MTDSPRNRKHIALISVHGLIRADHLELGRDADTGGQVKYVVELARALAEHSDVARVDLLTRKVIDPKVDEDYSRPFEEIAPGARIARLDCGPRRYLRKEVLWPHLDAFIDNAIRYFRQLGQSPDLIHSHYADAGYVGARLSQLLRIPLVHTGHSLGREKRRRLLESGTSAETIEERYHISQRIEAEEVALGNAALVIGSTHQEVREQYSRYENYHPSRMTVIPPGVDLDRFRPFRRGDPLPAVAPRVFRFFRDQRKPIILALSRPDYRKNIKTLIQAYGTSTSLRNRANLLIVAGTRDDLREMDRGAREVLTEMLTLIDYYDLYGSAAYPKDIQTSEVPEVYRLATRSRGVFVNPALTEPFGLTLLEAAASGLPVLATNDGGPTDIIGNCRNGILLDPLDAEGMGEAVQSALSNRQRWRRWSRNGLKRVREYYSWEAHVQRYLKRADKTVSTARSRDRFSPPKGRLLTVKRLLISDIDNTLTGDPEGLRLLLERLQESRVPLGLGIATGRRPESTLAILKECGVPVPDVLVTCVGAEIYYGQDMVQDLRWKKEIDYRWKPGALRELLDGFPGLELQPDSEQREHKVSYYMDPDIAPSLREIRKSMRQKALHAKLIFSHGQYLDLLPIRASKGLAIRYLALRWGISPETLLVAGDSGNDEEMLRGNTLGVVVGNYSSELESLRGQPRIYFATAAHARGVIEGLDHYGFLGEIRIPEESWEHQEESTVP